VVAVCTRATGWASLVSVVISQAAPTVWIQTPTLASTYADHIARKAGSAKGWRGRSGALSLDELEDKPPSYTGDLDDAG
jgi:hypothetical protein